MKIFLLTIAVLVSLQCNIYASWYGCAEYTAHELESMSENELREVFNKNLKLSDEIYEDAAVKSILDKRMYHFRSQQYMDCIEYRKEIEFFIQKKISERISDKQ